ncbi:OmpA family protein [Archangium lipolyticum]|uniref:OmpA family protein n=1 Tax=Archangium lipolyticum TaxID=2970465 RepID=UPI00214A3034|nr:OmpA family protein [Archangium lipolyticum]
MHSREIQWWLGGALALWAFTASAQSQRIPGFELERLQLNPGARDSLVLSTGDLLRRGQYRLSLTGHWENKPLVLFERGRESATIISNRVTAHLSGAWSVTDWLELGAQFPIVGQWAPNVSTVGLATPQSFALGTPWLQARANLFSERDGRPLDLGLHLGAALPVGSAEALTLDQGFVFSPRVGLGKRLGDAWRVGADVGALVRTRTYVLSPQVKAPRDELGVEVNGGLNLSAALFGLKQELLVRGSLPLARAPSSLEVLLGLRAPVGPVEVYAMGGPGFGKTPGTPLFRVLAGVTFSPERITPANPRVEVQPDPDTDGDGIADGSDACVNEAGIQENRGCPDRDRDGDGLVDRLDNCPDEKGTEKNGGCEEKQLARIDEGQLRTLEPVFFEQNKDILSPRSHELLDTVASILKTHPDMKLRVEGHTSNEGDAGYNLDLSQRRAEAVVEYIIGKGVERERLEPRGFGQTRPIADNDTSEGRAKNRRVEFKTDTLAK